MEVKSHKLDGSGSLSKKRTVTKKTVRTVLDTPYPLCPLLKDSGAITELLKRLTPIKQTPPLQWKLLKQMTPEERKRIRRETRPHIPKERHDIVIGMNEVLRGMEDGTVASVIISEEIKPKSLVNCFIEIAAVKQIPIVAISSLRKLSKVNLGVGTVAFAVKKTAAENEKSNLFKLHQAILCMAKEMNLLNNTAQFQKQTEEEEEQDASEMGVLHDNSAECSRGGSVECSRKYGRPYLRSFYEKREKSTRKHSLDKQNTVESHASIGNCANSTVEDQIPVSNQPKRSKGQENKIPLCSFKPLRVKEVISYGNKKIQRKEN